MESATSKDMADVVRIHEPSIERNIGKSKLLKLLAYVPVEVTINDIAVSITKKFVEFSVTLEMGGLSEIMTLRIAKSKKK